MPIDLATVNWVYVGLLAIFVFVASLVGHFLTLGHRGFGALLAAILFTAIFVAWSYYPHGLPLPTRLEAVRVVAPAPPSVPAPATTTAPARPANPVTTVSPPANPVTTISPPANPVTTISPPSAAAPKQ